MRDRDPFEHMHPWAGVQQIFGKPLEPKDLIDDIAKFGWRPAFVALANYAVLLATSSLTSTRYVRFTGDLLRRHWETALPQPEDVVRRVISSYFWRNTEHHVAHDEVIYFLQALVLLHGGDGEVEPNDRHVLQWMLAANDHLGVWDDDDEVGGDALDRLVADLARVTRFNNNVDIAGELARAIAVFGERPEQMTEARWREVSEKAFGDFHEHLEGVLVPLLLQTRHWTVGGEKTELPIIDVDDWYSKTTLSSERQALLKGRVRAMVWTREEAIEKLAPTVRANGLPRPPVIFFHRPFVALDETKIVASSPRMIHTHMQFGTWGRLRSAFTRGDEWTVAFGVVVESWCRRVARLAAQSATFAGQLVLSDNVGDADEIEDVVLVDGDNVALFSVKARLMAENLVKTGAKGRAAVTNWYEEVLFHQRTGGHKPGALRRLSEKIRDIRSGKHEPAISRHARVFPVVVTFESLGDNVALGAWINQRREALGLLADEQTAPPTLATVAQFEALMGLAANGKDVFSVIGQSDVAAGRYTQLQTHIYAAAPAATSRRVPGLWELFHGAVQGTTLRLFGRSIDSGPGDP